MLVYNGMLMGTGTAREHHAATQRAEGEREREVEPLWKETDEEEEEEEEGEGGGGGAVLHGFPSARSLRSNRPKRKTYEKTPKRNEMSSAESPNAPR